MTDGFDYATYLKRHLMAGQIDPWRKTDEGKPLYALLVSVDIAMEECLGWSKQELSKYQFINYLKVNDILVLSTPEDLSQIREERIEEVKVPKKKRAISDTERERRRNRMLQIRESQKDSVAENPR